MLDISMFLIPPENLIKFSWVFYEKYIKNKKTSCTFSDTQAFKYCCSVLLIVIEGLNLFYGMLMLE
jgi:hypothetical protein